MTDPPLSGDDSLYGDDLRTLLAAHLADYEPDRDRIQARIEAGRADQARHGTGWLGAGCDARHWPKLPVPMATLAAASLVAAAAVLFAVIDTGSPVQVSTTGPAAGPTADDGDGPAPFDGAGDDPVAATPPSAPDGPSDPTTDDQSLMAGTDVPGIRVPADDPDTTATTAVASTGGAGDPLSGTSASSAPPSAGGAGGGSPGGAEGVPALTTPPTTAAEATTRPSFNPQQPTTTVSPVRPTTAPPLPGPAIQTSLLPKQVQLGPTGYLDWVVVGARNDGRAVRMKAGTGHLTVTAPSGALPTPGLIPILWTGGNPEQERTDNDRWWTADAAPSSFVVQVAGADNASEVVLYAGSSSSLTVTVTVAGRGITQKTVSAGFFGSAAKVTVTLGGADRGRDATITVGAAKGSVSLGAVTER